jgi:outer membrane protein assembly factor BamB
MGFDTAGRKKWEVRTQTPFPGAAAIDNGVVFAALDDRFVALDITSGRELWSYASGSSAYASPAVVPSGVYFANDAGNVYAFGREP